MVYDHFMLTNEDEIVSSNTCRNSSDEYKTLKVCTFLTIFTVGLILGFFIRLFGVLLILSSWIHLRWFLRLRIELMS